MNISIYTVLLFLLYCVVLLTYNSGICTGSSQIECIPSEREVLLRFKYHLIDPSNRLSSWNSSNSNCCHWTGVVCSHVTANVLQLHLNTSPPSDDGYYSYDEYDKAYERLKLHGEINTSLVELKHLNHLDLSGNDFGGTQIPIFLGEMTSLTYLNLSHAGFYGNIPHQIGNLSNLLFLDLSYSSYYGNPLFAESLHWLSGLSHLQYLDLGNANLSKSFDWVQTLQALPSLVELRLSGCTFPIHYNQPSSLNFSSLTTLDFSYSYALISSVVPKWIFGLRKLVSLQLDANDIQGPMPGGIQNLTLLENLDLSWNSLSSSIPDWLYRLRHLKFLNLEDNNLRGNISDALGNLTSLVKLDLSNNQLEGRIPTSLGHLYNLREIGFSYLKLNQQVNEILETLTPCVSHGLTALRIQSSHLSGNLTDQIGLFKNLVELDFSNNSIHGALPISFEKLSSLRSLHLSKNRFNGALPSSFGKLSSLTSLYLSENQFNGNPFEVLQSGVVCSDVTSYVLQLHLNTSRPTYDDINYDKDFEEYLSQIFGGEISASLVELKHLNYLDLSGNDFGGTQIPTFLGEMTSLTYLNLSHAGFNGSIPHQIGNLSNLLFLDLSYSASGAIPYQIGNLTNLLSLRLPSSKTLFAENIEWLSGLSHLRYLDLGNANLSKSFDWVQTLQALPSLVELRLKGCTFPIHYNQLSSLNFSSLTTLDLSRTGISVVPKWIFGLRKLVSLQLQLNTIQGPIPDGIQNLTLLENLDLSLNSLSSSIPDWLYRLRHLKFLNLKENNLRGNISDALGNLTSLVKLDLSDNQLEGRIPTSLGNLCNLREIGFSYLKLNQQVNEILEILTPCVSHGLTELVMGYSQLSGNLTDQIGLFKNIEVLDLSYNSIHGALPSSFGKLSSLISLDLSENHFNGNPFEFLRSLSELSYLSIRDNLFQGVVKEDDLANFKSLKVLYASGNNLTLEVGPSWHPSFQLQILSMSSWQLGPNFPSWIQSQKDINNLYMSNTGISDSIPPWFWETFSIGCIDLSSNKLSGKLPYLFGDVGLLDLSSNLFSGTMTDFLCRNQGMPMQLYFMNLASNNLSGEIPDCWRRWTNLAEVNLRSNHFVGNLPPSMGSIASLKSLHIGNNALFGTFPHILKNNSGLISLDLGENKLTGIIPAWVGERLTNLKILRLRSNKFLGHIPNEICVLSFLQVLDLAQNNLSGNIPSCFNQLSAMTQKNKSEDPSISILTGDYFSSISMLLLLKGREDEYKNILGLVTSIDLSENKLLGEIPKEITNLDGLINLNLSMNQLSGQIPSSIGNMGSLLSIDFSRNELFGQIPQTISNLSLLSNLDLSYNDLKGEIPTGTQLQSFEASNFVGNNLCGPPLPINCSSHGQIPNDDHNVKESDRHGVNWFFVSMAFGFVVGFWAVVAPLFIFRSWRHTYYRFLDDMCYKVQSCW